MSFVTISSLSGLTSLKKSKIELELLTDIHMILILTITRVVKIYSEGNNKNINKIRPRKIFIIYYVF